MSVSRRKSPGDRLADIVIAAVMVLICVAILYPFLNLISISLSEDGYVLRGEVSFYPRGLDFYAYEQVFKSPAILRAFGNTLFVVVVGCVSSLVFTSLAAYPLAFAEFDGKKAYAAMIMVTMWFSGGMVPAFMVMSKLGLVDSLFALVLGNLIGAYNVVILKSFFSVIPKSLIESAKIDGAQDFSILFRIVLPLSKAALATIALWVIVGHWNDFMAPLIYLRDYKKFTLQITLNDIVLANSSDAYGIGSGTRGDDGGVAAISEQIKNAVVVVSMVPVLVIYPFLQRYFVKGVLLGAVKG